MYSWSKQTQCCFTNSHDSHSKKDTLPKLGTSFFKLYNNGWPKQQCISRREVLVECATDRFESK